MKKKAFVLILAGIVMIFTLASCSSAPAEENESSTTASQQTEDTVLITDGSVASTDTTPVQTELTTRAPVTGGALTDNGIDRNNDIVQSAEALIGVPFADNGDDPSTGFDNSGFIYYVLRENGFINCPRLIKEQADMGTKIGYAQLKSGDLAFFSNDGGTVDFGGIYIGDGQMIYCPMPGQTVKIADISTDYWQNAFVTGVSLS